MANIGALHTRYSANIGVNGAQVMQHEIKGNRERKSNTCPLAVDDYRCCHSICTK